ncbi:MAG: tyrosine-type recombinase/integrase [Chloroflexi bacterium]|nr:tyrosine-type recombinase/integrase [Chloroflexota bacterium]
MKPVIAKRHLETINTGYVINDAWEEFAIRLKGEGKSKNTVAVYKSGVLGLADFLEERGMPTTVEAISGEHIAEYMASLQGRFMPATCKARFSALRVFFGWLIGEDEINDSPMRRLNPPQVPFQVREGFSREELAALFATVQGREFLAIRDRAIFAVMLSTGLRVAELCSVKVEDVVGGDHIVIKGKGAKERVVRLGNVAAQTVRRYLRRRGGSDVAALFIGVTNEPLSPQAVKLMYGRRGDQAEIKKCHPHRMRRTFALDFLDSGGLPDDLRVLMGHSSQHVLRQYVAAREQDRALRAHEEHDPADRLMRER